MKVLEDGRIQFKRGIPQSLQKHQTVEITVTLPYDRNGPMLQPIQRKTVIYYNTTFMEAIQKAQQKYRGLPISARTLSFQFKEDRGKG